MPQSAAQRIGRLALLTAVAGLVLAACSTSDTHPTASGSPSTGHPSAGSGTSANSAAYAGWPSWLAAAERKVRGQPGHLQPGSNPSVLPGPLLIADNHNNRLLIVDPKGRILWQFPGPKGLPAGQSFLVPDDAFFTPHGNQIVATEEDNFVISRINPKTEQFIWRYGTPGTPGFGPNQLDNPDDAIPLPGGSLVTADIKNCRLLLIGPGAHTPSQIFGQTTNYCYHSPPARFGSPNGAFPLSNGNLLVTEINGDWVDEMTRSGQILWSTHPPGFYYPSDTNQVSPGVFVSVDYTYPGILETFNQAGQLLWRYQPQPGQPQLNHPSLAEPLPNGDFVLNDDMNHRVIVIDPRTNQVVWQYGVTGVSGTAPGYLNNPDGIDLAPPHSLTDRFTSALKRGGW